MECYTLLEVWKFLDYEMHRDVDMEDSVSMQIHNTIKFAAYTQQQTHKILSNTHLDEGTNVKRQSIKVTVALIH